MKSRKLSNLGKAIAEGVSVSQVKVPLDQALFLQSYTNMGKVGYTTFRLSLLPYGLVLPPYDETARHKYEDIVPKNMVCFIFSTSDYILTLLCVYLHLD